MYDVNRINSIDNQINLLQQQKNALMNIQPPIQQTFVTNAQNGPQYDFNGKWVDGIEEAKQVAGNNLPLVIFDRNEDRFYMKSLDGKITAYKFEEVKITDPKDAEIEKLKKTIKELKDKLKEKDDE